MLILHIEDYEFRLDSPEGEPCVLDVEIGKRAGLSRPRDIRKLIRRLTESGFLAESDMRATVARMQIVKPTGGVEHREVTEYWLTETGALKVITKLETPKAHAMVGDIIRVYRAAVRSMAAPQLPPPPSAPQLPSVGGFAAMLTACKTVGEHPEWKRDLRDLIAFAGVRTARSWQSVHGALRKYLGVVGYLRIPASLVEESKRYLHGLSCGTLLLPGKAPKPRLIHNANQLAMRFDRPTS